MKLIKYATVREDVDKNTLESKQEIEYWGIQCSDDQLDTRLSNIIKIAYNGEYTIEDIPMTAEEARAQRDKLLADTDWTQVLDAPIDTETRDAYQAYRQALRDIPEQEGFPETIVWPELPAKVKAAPDPVDEAVDLLLSGATGEEAAT